MKKKQKFSIKYYFWLGFIVLVLLVVVLISNVVIFRNKADYNKAALLPLPSSNQISRVPIDGNRQIKSQTQVSSTGQSLRLDIDQILARVLPAVPSVFRPGVLSERKNTGGAVLLLPAGSMTRTETAGSGVIVDDRGYMLTTFQTVGKSTLVKIHLRAEVDREYLADVIGVDPSCDLALLKIRSNRIFSAIPLGNSDKLQVGDVVFAVGNPFGFTGSVTMGIVSSNCRKVDISGVRYPDLIQTDAAVNEGNDGGPLVNLAGEVVGINIACFMPDHRYSGISFAVPIKDAAGLLSGQIR